MHVLTSIASASGASCFSGGGEISSIAGRSEEVVLASVVAPCSASEFVSEVCEAAAAYSGSD